MCKQLANAPAALDPAGSLARGHHSQSIFNFQRVHQSINDHPCEQARAYTEEHKRKYVCSFSYA